jgi:alpha-tubulin suppressor-like RCC1 family protein
VVVAACQVSVPLDGGLVDGAADDVLATCTGMGCPVSLGIVTNAQSTCSRMADQTVRCWGAYNGSHIPRQVFLVSATDQLALGDDYLCWRTGTSVSCFGNNASGQLGDGTNAARTAPVEVTGVGLVKQLVAAVATTCALRTDGTVACWGSNTRGQLGDGSMQNRSTPQPVTSLANVESIAMNRESVCAVMHDTTLRCWGGPFGNVPMMNVANLSGVAEIAMGQSHYCARITDGSVRCWGQNTYGQLGDGTMLARTIPTAVIGVADAAHIAVGATHSCVLLRNGTVQCWGQNDVGQLGDGTTMSRVMPLTVPSLSGVVDLQIGLATSAGSGHNCALRDDGSVYCWGHNQQGQLGDGTVMYRTVPTRVVF